MNNIGFIGLGNMGKGMAINLSKNNLNVFGYDLCILRRAHKGKIGIIVWDWFRCFCYNICVYVKILF